MERSEAAAARRARLRIGAASVCAALAATVALAALPWTSNWVARIDAVAFDAHVRWIRLRGAPQATRFDPNVAIVGVDAASLNAVGAVQIEDRQAVEALGAALAGIASAAPRAIVIDLPWPADRAGDALLDGVARAIAVAPVVLVVERDASGRPLSQPAYAFETARNVAAPALGSALDAVDVDGIVRRVPAGDAALPTVIEAVARRLGRAGATEGWIDFTRGAPFAHVPLEYVARWHRTGDRERLRAVLGDRIVLVGDLLPGARRVALPVRLAAWESGERAPRVVAHAQALRSIVGAGLVRPAAGWIGLGLAFAFALAAVPASARLRWSMLAAGAVAAFVWTAAIHEQGRFVPLGHAAISGVAAAVLRAALERRRTAGSEAR
ncbi:MAG: CHASE2 domain-containing protein [Burkholderiaceae bacterium]|nr:CHASE2 domain-containing protein [Burkholderiaceae bacterium]